LAGAATTPSFAAPDDSTAREQVRAERQQAREDRQQARDEARSERSIDRSSSFSQPDRPARQTDVAQHQSVDQSARIQDRDTARAQRIDDRNAARAERSTSRDSFQGDRAQRAEDRQQRVDQLRDNRELRQSSRPLPNVMRTRTPVISDTPKEGTQPPLRADSRPVAQPTWSTSWRHNDKYDWYNWRKKHRWLYHFGFYYDPFGWSYSPYSIGWRLWPSYYSSRYWLYDPWQYRLPYAPPGYRWIRYWDDAILVDTWTGEVVDVIYNFFW
jgi:hypothetical protein